MTPYIFGKLSGYPFENAANAEAANVMLMTADRGHHGQFRADDKTPYIEHPKTVSARVSRKLHQLATGGYGPLPGRLFTASQMPVWSTDKIKLIARGATLFHDTKEDSPSFNYLSELNATGLFDPVFLLRVDRIVTALSNTSGGDYLEYLHSLQRLYFEPRSSLPPIEALNDEEAYRADFEDTAITLLAKQADMEANLLDLDNIQSRGRRKSLQTKYLLAHWILFGCRPDLSPL